MIIDQPLPLMIFTLSKNRQILWSWQKIPGIKLNVSLLLHIEIPVGIWQIKMIIIWQFAQSYEGS